MADQAERELYAPVKAFLERAGFEVKGELRGCDVVGVAAGQTVIVELKLSFSLELVLQAVDRMALADEVWVAVPATKRGRDQDRRVRKLCRLMGLGLMAVTTRTGLVEVLADPGPYRPRADTKRARLLLKEHQRRRGDPSEGGSTRAPVMTAYRQQALAIAQALAAAPASPASLKPLAPDAAPILQRNVYGWFERERRGIYRLTEAGAAALLTWKAHLAA